MKRVREVLKRKNLVVEMKRQIVRYNEHFEQVCKAAALLEKDQAAEQAKKYTETGADYAKRLKRWWDDADARGRAGKSIHTREDGVRRRRPDQASRSATHAG